MSDLGVRDLVLATIDDASGRGGKRAAARLGALRHAFNLDLKGGHPHDPLKHLFEDAVASYLSLRSPFDGYLEAPPEVIRMHRHHGPRISSQVEGLREALLDLLTDLAVARWALPPSGRVDEKELAHFGFDPAKFPEPDLDDW